MRVFESTVSVLMWMRLAWRLGSAQVESGFELRRTVWAETGASRAQALFEWIASSGGAPIKELEELPWSPSPTPA